jgi:hypothetical protein
MKERDLIKQLIVQTSMNLDEISRWLGTEYEVVYTIANGMTNVTEYKDLTPNYVMVPVPPQLVPYYGMNGMKLSDLTFLQQNDIITLGNNEVVAIDGDYTNIDEDNLELMSPLEALRFKAEQRDATIAWEIDNAGLAIAVQELQKARSYNDDED